MTEAQVEMYLLFNPNPAEYGSGALPGARRSVILAEFMAEMSLLEREELRVLLLNTKNQVLAIGS